MPWMADLNLIIIIIIIIKMEQNRVFIADDWPVSH